MRILILLIVMGLSISVANAANPVIENQLAEYIQHQQAAQLSLLEQLVNINSGTANSQGIKKTAALLRPQFEALGFTVRWIPEPAEMKRAGTFIAEHPGKKGKRLLLIGHLDTVFPATSSFQRFKQTGSFATGPGVIDDKGGDVVILYALKALHAAHQLDDANITVVFTGDEEDSGKPTTISRKPLIDIAKQSDIALEFEWAITQDTATVARRGITNWMLTTEGKEAHSSEIFQENAGFGAIFELTRILDTMRIELANEHDLSFNPGLLLGGTTIDYDTTHSQGTAFGKGNVIAKTARSKGDLRYLTTEQKTRAEEKIAAIVAAHLPHTNATITFQDGIPAMPPTDAHLALLKQYSDASIQLGYGAVKPVDPGSRGASDVSHVAPFVSAQLAGLGPVGTGAHSDKETLDINSLPMQTKRAALLIYRLTQTT